MASNRRFTISMRTTGYTKALKNGDIKIPGIELNFVEMKPQIAPSGG